MEMKNLEGKWPYVAINPATGKPYEAEHMDNGVSVQKRPNDLREEIEADIDYYRDEENPNCLYVPIYRVYSWLNRQADSFAAIENENIALRLKLKRIRELAERLQDA